jgi:hypothetical protein
MPALTRRRLLATGAAVAATSLLPRPLLADNPVTFGYRGFTVDTTAAQGVPNLQAIEA